MSKETHTDAAAFGPHLAKLRKAAGFTQVTLARTLDVSQQTIARWETMDHPPPSKIIPQLANLFHVTVEQLLNIHAEPVSKKRGPSGRAEVLFQRVSALPRRQQEQVLQMVTLYLEAQRDNT